MLISLSTTGYAQYSGGNSDGFGSGAACTTNLNGTSTALTIGSISGPAVFCNNSSETFSIPITTGTADSYSWTGPTGTTVASQQIDGYANLLFGNTAGNVTVQVSNACATVSTNLAVTNATCQQFSGGNGDGHDEEASCSTTLNGVGTGLTIGTISGPSSFCDNSNETFSVNITSGSADNFLWTGPTGTTVASQQIDGYVNLLFGNTSGNVTVQVSNACATVSTNLAVTNATCQQFSGGNGDGHGEEASCSTTLNGVGTGLTIGTISGPSSFCDNSNETFSVNITSGSADNFLWMGPTGTTVASQQIDGYANLLFGNTSGNVTVQVSNACATVSTNLAVTNATCQQFNGGNGDGHDDEASCSTTLNGVGTGLTIGTISGPSSFCDNSSETFSVNITSGSADNFLWMGPTGTTVASQQIDGYANLLFGNTSGNVTVQVSNACATVSTNLAVTNATCQQFNGGNGDGHDDEASCSTTLNGVDTGLTIGTISGPSSFCDNSSETFSVNITSGSADNFLWTGPTGTTVASQQVDGYANLLFGNTAGNVTVQVSNACATVSTNLAVTNATCQQFSGGNADGHDEEASCSTALNGVGTGLTIGTISGPSSFCDNSNETFSVNITSGSADNFLWTGPIGTTVASQQVDGYANLLFGNTAGNVTVQVSNACATVSTNLAVTNTTCTNNLGGFGDGFAFASSSMSISLPVELVSFQASVANKAVKLIWSTASETNNDYFSIERSINLNTWEPVEKIKGAGNSNSLIAYVAYDTDPYPGLSYYRLKQVDFDGSTYYSEVVSAIINNQGIIVYPNPAHNIIYINLASDQPTQLTLTNTSGKTLIETQRTSTNLIPFDLSDMKSGVYFIKIQTSSSTEIRKIELIQ